MAPQVLISLDDNVLTLYLSPDDWLSRGHCSTLAILIECPTAAEFRPGTFYQPVRARACEDTVAEGQARCPRHECDSMFTCHVKDGTTVAAASTTQKLAALLQLSEVRICGAVSKQPLSLPNSLTGDTGGLMPQQQQQPQQPASQQLEQPMQTSPTQKPCQQQQQQEPSAQTPKRELNVKVPKLGGSSSTVRTPCCTVLLMADVDSPEHFVLGPTYPVMYSWCCGREASGRDFCRMHETSRFVVTDRNLSVVASVATLQLLAAVLGYSAVNITSEQQDLLQKLMSSGPASATAAAAAGSSAGTSMPAAAAAAAGGGSGFASAGQTAMLVDSPPLPPQPQQQQLEVGQKRSSAEAELPSSLGNGKKPPNSRSGASAAAAAAGNGAGSSSAGKGSKEVHDLKPMFLRLNLTAEDAAVQRQALQERRAALRQQQGQQQQLAAVDAELSQLEVMAGGGVDVRLPVPHGSGLNPDTRCLGVTLQLNVASLKQLVEARTFVPILKGEQCGHEGGAKKACKKHKMCSFTLQSLTGQTVTNATHLAGLAHRLQASAASIVDSSGNPNPDYTELPRTPTWHQAPDSSSFTVWLPPDAKSLSGNWQNRPCSGLDVYVEQPKDVQQAVGLVMSVVRCGNEAGAKATCKRHAAKVLQLYSWNDSLSTSTQLHITPGDKMIHACSDLPQLAMWLGVGKVEVLDADSQQPLSYYKGLSIPPPTQLPLIGPQAHLLTPPNLAPPSFSGGPGATSSAVPGVNTAGNAAGEAAAAAAAGTGGVVGADGRSAAAAAAAGGSGGGEGAAGVVGGGELGALLASAAQAGGAKAVNLFGNSRVEFLQLGTQQPDDGSQQQQQQQQQQVVIRVDPRPVGGNQGRPCCMLDIVLLLQNKAAYQQGQQYPALFAHRCGNEAGNRSRCRQHADAAVRILASDAASAQSAAAAQGMPLFALQTAKSALTHTIATAIIQDSQLACKVNSSSQAATVLGVDAFQLLDAVTGEDLKDLATWSPTNSTGTAAKVVHCSSSRDAAAAAAALAAAAAAGVPGIPTAQAILAALRNGGLSVGPLTAVQPIELDMSAHASAPPAAAIVAAAAAAAQAGATPAAVGGSGGGGVALASAGGDGTAGAGATAAVTPDQSAVQGVSQQLSGASLEQQQQGQSTAAQVAGATASTLPPTAAATPATAEQQQQQSGPPGVTAAATPAASTGATPAAAAAAAVAAAAAAPTSIAGAPPGLQAAAVAAPKPGPGTLAATAAAAAASGFGSSAPSHLAAWAVKFRAGTPPGPR